ncbi:hypothetical protein BTO30_03505 [Domibacillus antri]|uniref:SLH domain-containing protein n=1 Tax=Domibacillus antri TaxID=1714264 RepID=A0A1Q8Q8H3_9BACI|nr:S-layer homology domain-containing protein [Domibacillus antri]OLN23647.1 hypothetical protein BTO30_03505 [Domibacillus antri]
MKKKRKKVSAAALSSLLAFSLVTPVLANDLDDREAQTVTFNDTTYMEWVAESIGRMKIKGVFQGYENGQFKPNEPVSRMQSIITAVRLLGLEEEAKNASLNVKLPFKDADQFNSRMKGYIIVALDQGLIDSSAQNLSPNKPAERVWISSLLVRTLGLQNEAALANTETLDFKDAKQIPASLIGDVYVASKYDIFSGNGAGLFSPNTPITRAQMAAVLDRTYGQLLEEKGAATVKGIVTDVSTSDGTITVKTFNGESVTFSVPDNVLVQYHNRFMAPDQVLAGDNIELQVENNVVVEAAIFPESVQTEATNGIQKIEIELELKDGSEIEIEFESKRGNVKAEVKTDGEKYKGDEAITQIEQYLAEWNLTPDMTEEEIKTIILSSFADAELDEINIELKFSNGTKLEWEQDGDDDDHDDEGRDDDDDDRHHGGRDDDENRNDRTDAPSNDNNNGNLENRPDAPSNNNSNPIR